MQFGLLNTIEFAHHLVAISRGVNRLSTNLAIYQIESDHFIPVADHEMFKLDGSLRAYAPALTATGALCHIMLEDTLASSIIRGQGNRWTILDARQASVTCFVYSEIAHDVVPGSPVCQLPVKPEKGF